MTGVPLNEGGKARRRGYPGNISYEIKNSIPDIKIQYLFNDE